MMTITYSKPILQFADSPAQVLPGSLLDLMDALKKGDEAGWSLLDDQKLLQIHTHEFYAPRLQHLHEKALSYQNQEIPVPRFSLFKLFDENGSRIEYQDVYNARRERLITLAWDVLFNGSDISELEDMLWSTCDEYSWTLPAHFGYGGTKIPAELQPADDGSGFLRPCLYEQPQLIDLTNACTAAGLAEIVYLLEDKLHKAVVYRCRQEINRRVLQPYLSSNVPFGWESSPHNWASVCAGNIGIAAIYLIPDSRMLAPILLRCIASMNGYLQGFKDDGACLEGMGYWSYGFSSFMMFADLLKRRTGGAADYFKLKKVHEIALFQQRGFLTGPNGVCFSDANRNPKCYYMTTHYLKDLYPDVTVPDLGEDWDMLANKEYPTIVLREFLWSNPDYTPTGTPDGETLFPDSQWVISHTTLPFGKAAFAIKGGHNDEPHNHNDVGSFLLDLDGEVLVGDLGGGTYNKFYFTDKRYDFLVNGSQGHPLPMINGHCQKGGREYASRGFSMSVFSSGNAAASSIDDRVQVTQDLSGAYGLEELKSLIRTAVFQKDNADLSIRDDYSFSVTGCSVIERFLTRYPSFLEEEGKKVRICGEKHDLLVSAKDADGKVLSWELLTDEYDKDGIVPVWILETKAVEPKSIQIEFTPEI